MADFEGKIFVAWTAPLYRRGVAPLPSAGPEGEGPSPITECLVDCFVDGLTMSQMSFFDILNLFLFFSLKKVTMVCTLCVYIL